MQKNATLQLNKFTTLQQIMTWTEILAPIKNTEYFETLWRNVEEEYATTKCFPAKVQEIQALLNLLYG